MMKITSQENISTRKKADCLLLFFFEKKAAFSNRPLEKAVEIMIKSGDFEGKRNENSLIYPVRQKEKRFLLVGLGKQKELSEDQLRQAVGNAIRFCVGKGMSHINILLPDRLDIPRENLLSILADGALLANYLFDKYKTKQKQKKLIGGFCFVGAKKKELSFIREKEHISEGVYLARDLVNENADVYTPQEMAKAAKALEKISSKIRVKILNKSQIEKEKMGLLLAVSQGSSVDPTFAVIEYRPMAKKEGDHPLLIGKGITYDSGGLCLKPPKAMEAMKSDMAGAAAVIGTMHVLAKLNWPIPVTAIFAATENAIGPKSYKPGDVFVSMSGKSVEIGNTDAEGRLILADSISYALKYYTPSHIIDIATLTGAIKVALGEEIAGMYSNDTTLSKMLKIASENTGEYLWQMPLFEDYIELMKSDYADINNTGKDGKGGSITAALFLKEFVEGVKWAHIDFGSSAWYSKPKGYYPTHATGVGVRLFVEYLRLLIEEKPVA